MFYQPRPVFARRPTYVRRPRTVYRRPQNDIFGFSDFIGGLNRTTEIPIRMVDESEPQNLRAQFFDTENRKVQDSNVLDSQVQESKTQDSEPQNNIDETASETSQNHNLILAVQKTSRDIIKQIENTDLDCLDTKQETKMFKYAAENLYKLLEKLDTIHTADSEEKSLRKSTVKSIQRKLDSIDRKLANLEK